MQSIFGPRQASRTPRRFLQCPRNNSLLSPIKSGGPTVTLDNILASLFPDGHDVTNDHGVLSGSGQVRSGARMFVIGVADRTAVGVDEAIRLSRYILESIENGSGPILVIVDSDSQRMSKRD